MMINIYEYVLAQESCIHCNEFMDTESLSSHLCTARSWACQSLELEDLAGQERKDFGSL